MHIVQKFEVVTWNKTASVCDLERNRKYPILRVKRITTTIGHAVVLNIRDLLEDPAQVFLPKRYSDVVMGDDTKKINANTLPESCLQRRLCNEESLPVSYRNVVHIFSLNYMYTLLS